MNLDTFTNCKRTCFIFFIFFTAFNLINAQTDPDCGDCVWFEVRHFHEIAGHPFFGNPQEIQMHCITENTDIFYVTNDEAAASAFDIVRDWQSTADCQPLSHSPVIGFLDSNNDFVTNPDSKEYGIINPITVTANHIEFNYTHPGNPPPADEKFRTIKIGLQYTFDAFTFIEGIITIEVYRTPVLMVHGLWSNSGGFKDMEDNFRQGNYEPYQLKRMDYEPTNDHPFIANFPQVQNEINQLISQCSSKELAVGKVDLVGHSMGGILSRLHCQDANYAGDVRRVVTCNTPHAGSQLPDFLLDLNSVLAFLLCEVIDAAPEPTGSCYDGAINDLRVSSVATLIDLNGGAMPSDIGVHALTTKEEITVVHLPTSGALPFSFISAWTALIGSTCVGNFLDNVFNFDDHDIIVPHQSQAGGLAGASTSLVPNQQHAGSTANSNVIDQVKGMLNQPPSASSFSNSGYNPPILNYNPPALCFDEPIVDDRSQTATINITSPTAGTNFNSGDVVTIEVDGSSDIDSIVVMLFHTADSVLVIKSDGPTATVNITIPQSTLGIRSILAMGFDASDNLLAISSAVEIEVNTLATLTEITVYPEEIYLENGKSTNLEITGKYSDGIDRDLSKDSSLSFSFNVGNASKTGTNRIQLNSAGNDTLIINHLGISSENVPIKYIFPASALAVELVAFNAVPDGRGNVKLNWTTALEVGVNSFEIQRSQDGTNFESLEKIPSKNTGLVENNYSFLDKLTPKGWLYYRLKTIENTGQIEYSPVRSVLLEDDNLGQFQVYPNPAKDILSIKSLDGNEGIHEVRILDLLGREVMRSDVDFSFQNSLDFEIANILSKGVYFVEINQSGIQKLNQKVVILGKK